MGARFVTTYRLSRKPIPGPGRSGPIVHVSPPLRLYFYPSALGRESKTERLGNTGKRTVDETHTYGFGAIYVVQAGAVVATYEARGGPKETFYGDDDHVHSSIPPGDYVLSGPRHHVTPNWPNSCIPWGAEIRQEPDGAISFNPGEGWAPATGSPAAAMNLALKSLLKRKKTLSQ